jgi:hypothetical protein
MRPTTLTAARPPRPYHHRTPDTPQDPRPGPAPRPQRPTTTRTPQLTPDKPVLDPANVHPYRDHSASARDTALPDALGQETPGGPSVCPHRHGAAAHQHHTRPGTHQDPSAPTMPGNRPTHRHPQCRSTTPYALRHSYTQRHADGGVPVDVLKELMDHAAVATTMGYYRVGLKRNSRPSARSGHWL